MRHSPKHLWYPTSRCRVFSFPQKQWPCCCPGCERRTVSHQTWWYEEIPKGRYGKIYNDLHDPLLLMVQNNLEDHPTASNPGDRKSPFRIGLSNIYKWLNELTPETLTSYFSWDHPPRTTNRFPVPSGPSTNPSVLQVQRLEPQNHMERSLVVFGSWRTCPV